MNTTIYTLTAERDALNARIYQAASAAFAADIVAALDELDEPAPDALEVKFDGEFDGDIPLVWVHVNDEIHDGIMSDVNAWESFHNFAQALLATNGWNARELCDESVALSVKAESGDVADKDPADDVDALHSRLTVDMSEQVRDIVNDALADLGYHLSMHSATAVWDEQYDNGQSGTPYLTDVKVVDRYGHVSTLKHMEDEQAVVDALFDSAFGVGAGPFGQYERLFVRGGEYPHTVKFGMELVNGASSGDIPTVESPSPNTAGSEYVWNPRSDRDRKAAITALTVLDPTLNRPQAADTLRDGTSDLARLVGAAHSHGATMEQVGEAAAALFNARNNSDPNNPRLGLTAQARWRYGYGLTAHTTPHVDSDGKPSEDSLDMRTTHGFSECKMMSVGDSRTAATGLPSGCTDPMRITKFVESRLGLR